MTWNKRISYGILLGMLVSAFIVIALPAKAGEPGTERRLLSEIPRENPNYGSLPNVLHPEPLAPEPYAPPREYEKEYVVEDELPANLSPEALRAQAELERTRADIRLRAENQQHHHQMDRERFALQRERDQQRYQYQASRYGNYGGYNNYYPTYTPPVYQPPMYQQAAYQQMYQPIQPIYQPVPVYQPSYDPFLSLSFSSGRYHSCHYSPRRTYGYGSYYGGRRGGHRHCH